MAAALADRFWAQVARMGERPLTAAAIAVRTADRTLRDGFIHAGNLAYLSLVTLFPATILIHAFAASFGRTELGRETIGNFLGTLPREVADLVGPVVDEVVEARSGAALAAGGLIALWTTSSFVGTIRDMLHRAHELPTDAPFWMDRLFAVLVTLAALFVILVAFFGQLVLRLMVATVSPYVPLAQTLVGLLDISRVTGVVAVFLSLWLLFRVLSPAPIRRGRARIWPGALIVTLVWAGATWTLAPMMANAANFSLTYGAFTGVMLALLFFYVVGFAIVAGCETNAALASRESVAEMVADWRRQAAARGHATEGADG